METPNNQEYPSDPTPEIEKPANFSDFDWSILQKHTEGLHLSDSWGINEEELSALLDNVINHTQAYDPAEVKNFLCGTEWREVFYLKKKQIGSTEIIDDYIIGFANIPFIEGYTWSYHTFHSDGGYEGYSLPSDFGYWERIGELPEGRLPDEIVWNSVLTWSFAPEERSLTIHQLYEGQTAEESWQVLGIDSDILIISAPSARDAAVTRYYLYFPPEPER